MNSSTDSKALWPGWETVRLIGKGSFGAVYEIERDVFGHKEKAALKMISIPQNDSDIEELYDSGYDEASVTATFKSHLQSIVNEYSLMREMNGAANVVNCDDFRVVQHDDSIGWDIYIKMELLTPITKALDKNLSDEQVIRIGKDLCHALMLCKKYNIVHRDIKPQNIFVSKNGDYKLGDFGIAKTMERTSGGTKVGTYKYMAPEVYNNQPYNQRADIYSLGLVLHWMLNERRSPFMPLPPEPAVASMEEQARLRRFQGEPIPAPAHGSGELKQIVLKACAYDPKDRYQSAAEMLSALEGLGKTAGQEPVFPAQPAEENDDPTEGFGWKAKEPEPEEDKTVGAWTKQKSEAEPEEEKTVSAWGKKETDKPAPAPTPEKKSGKKKIIGIIAACLALVFVAGIVWITAGGKKKETANESDNKATNEATSEATSEAANEITDEITDEITKGSVVAISAGRDFTVGLRSDGIVIAVGNNGNGQCKVSEWRDIVAISAGKNFTVGLQSDGTVVAVGNNNFRQCNVSDWSDIVKIGAGDFHTVGLRSDGTVVATGENKAGQCNVSEWKNITEVSAGGNFTVGLRSDGTVVAVGDNGNGQCNVSKWRDIIAISAGNEFTVGLRSDGTVVAAGANYNSQCDVSDWREIIAISAGDCHAVGLRSDGTVVYAGIECDAKEDMYTWNDIVAISAGAFYTVGLRSDGTLVAVGDNNDGQCDVSDW